MNVAARAEALEKRPTWRQLGADVAARLGSPLDARRILERVSGHAGAQLHLVLDERAPAEVDGLLRSLVERRAAGEPLQYVVGRWGFRRLDLAVDRRVLIPRPETETVVEVALEQAVLVQGAPTAATGNQRFVAVDLGTGSGAIALSLATELSDVVAGETEVWATEQSAAALAVARTNLATQPAPVRARVRFGQGSWFAPLPSELRGSVALIVANPPYIGEDEVPAAEVAWEPPEALFAGPRGLEAVEEILGQAPAWLRPGGAVVLEIAPHQAERAALLAGAAGLSAADVRRDLAGRLRVVVARQCAALR